MSDEPAPPHPDASSSGESLPPRRAPTDGAAAAHGASSSDGASADGASADSAAATDGAATMLREGGKLSILTLASRVLGLLREMSRAAFMGTGMLADSFTVSFMIPNLFRRLFAEGSISVAFIPTFKAFLIEGDEARTRRFLSASFTVLLILLSAIVALGIACTPLLVGLFDAEVVETTVLTRMMFPFLAIVSIAALLQGILNSIGVFAISGAAPILFNIAFIAVPWLVAPYTANPARAMAVGVLVGGLLQTLCQLPAVIRAGWGFGLLGPLAAFRDPGVRRILRLIGPTIIGMAAYQLNELVSTAVASRTGIGVATSLTFSLRLLELVLGVFAVSAGTVLLPELSEAVAKKDWSRFTKSLGRSLDLIALVTIPVAVFSMAMGKEIVVLLFQAREFGAESAELTTNAFFFHMMGLYFIAANRIIAPAFYARGDSKSPTWAGIAAMGINIALAFALALPLSGGGIALALSIASAANTLFLVILSLRSRIEGLAFVFRRALKYVGKLLALSALALGALLLAKPTILSLFAGSTSRFASAGMPLLLCGLLYAAIGIGGLVLTRDEVGAGLVKGLRRRRRK